MPLEMMTLPEVLWNRLTQIIMFEKLMYNFDCFAKSCISPPPLSKIRVKVLLAEISPLSLWVNRFLEKFLCCHFIYAW